MEPTALDDTAVGAIALALQTGSERAQREAEHH
jgi:hypothetical protein